MRSHHQPGAQLCNSEMVKTLPTVLGHLQEAQQHDITQLVDRFPSLFHDVPTQTNVITHDIDVKGARPIKQHPYRANPTKRALMKQEADYLVANGLATQSSSPWCSPCLVEAKSDGSPRFITDYRKVNAVTYTVMAFGCNANIFYADAPKPQIELLTEAFHDYVATAKETADDTLQMIDHSQFGKHVFNLLISRYMAAFYFASAVHEQLPPATKDMIHKVNRESWRLERELAAVLETYTNNMEAQIQQRVEQLKQELAPYAESLDTEALRAALEQKSEKLRQSVKDLQVQLGPYTDYLKLKVDQHLQDFQERMAPVTEKVHRQLIQRANQVQKMAAPYVEDLKVKLDPYAQVLQARLTSLYEAYAKST
nr:apolipoprotein A-I-like [Pseudochaenichthys georgianus]